MRRLLCLLVCLPLLTLARAESLDSFQWKKRVLLILTPSTEDPRYANQAAALLPRLPELAERDVIIITALPGDAARSRLPLPADGFAALLIGLDGGIKLTRGDVMTAATVIDEIDRMPMRRSELRGQTQARLDGNTDAPLTANEVIELLGLVPETTSTGFFTEVYRSASRWPADTSGPETEPGDDFPAGRAAASNITYLFAGPDAQHRLQSHRADEIYHFLAGDPIEVLLLPAADATETEARVIVMGNDLAAGHVPQLVLPAGSAYTSRIRPGGRTGWSLIGATVVPGWQVDDVIRPDAEALAARFPSFADRIRSAVANDRD